MIRTFGSFRCRGSSCFPGTLLPLHIFEERYRALVADALREDRTIGMAMWKPGWQGSAEAPPICPIGGAGEIVESEELEDGRYNILLQARFRFRVLEEEAAGRPYRVARVEELRSLPFPDADEQTRTLSAAVRSFPISPTISSCRRFRPRRSPPNAWPPRSRCACGTRRRSCRPSSRPTPFPRATRR